MVFDCCVFYNEFELLDIRLHTLNEVVDYFVIAEATSTFSAHSKPLYLSDNLDRYKKFKDKLRIIVVDDFEEMDKTKLGGKIGNRPFFRREFHQRNALKRGLDGAKLNDYIMLGDVDEIAKPEIVREAVATNASLIQIRTKLYYYFLNLEFQKETWGQPRMVRFEHFDTMCKLRNVKGTGIKERLEGGWHFSWQGGLDAMADKLNAFSHQDINSPKTIEKMKNAIPGRTRFFRNNEKVATLEQVPLSELPVYVQENEQHFRKLKMLL